jgi:hypothetical protein
MHWTPKAPTAPGFYLVWLVPLPWWRELGNLQEGPRLGELLPNGDLRICNEDPYWAFALPTYTDEVAQIVAWAEVTKPKEGERLTADSIS